VGGEMMKLEAELLQEQEEEGGDRRGILPNSPVARSRRGILPALIFPAGADTDHPRRRRTESS
jgi:hypothetical protein